MRAVSACVSAPREASEVDDAGVPPGGTRCAVAVPGAPSREAVGPRRTPWDRAGARVEARAALLRPFTVRSKKEGLQSMCDY